MGSAITRFARFCVLALVLLSAVACRRSSDEDPHYSAGAPRNLIWIVVDTLRPDALSCYGGVAKTPNIDGLAANGVLFSTAYSHVPATGPSHSSMFTGLLPEQHGVAINTQVLGKSLTTAAEILRERGFHTAAVVSLGVLQRKFGFGQGFQQFDDRFPDQWFRSADDVTRSALALVDARPEGPLFLFVHYSDPHEPYCPPSLTYPRITVKVNGVAAAEVEANGLGARLNVALKPGENTITFVDATDSDSRRIKFRQIWIRKTPAEIRLGAGWTAAEGEKPGSLNIARLPATLHVEPQGDPGESSLLHFFAYEVLSHPEARERYIQEVEFADQEIGVLMTGLEVRGLLSDTLVVFTSDHGEGLGDHDQLGHINQLYDSMVRVPLIFMTKARKLTVGKPGELVSHIDILPTLADLLGIDIPYELPGQSLFARREVREARSAPSVLLRTYRPEAPFDLGGIVHGGFKYITNRQTGEEELFSIPDDPGEILNLLGADGNPDSRKTADGLRSTLEESLATSEIANGTDVETLGLEQEEIEKLKALGYLQ